MSQDALLQLTAEGGGKGAVLLRELMVLNNAYPTWHFIEIARCMALRGMSLIGIVVILYGILVKFIMRKKWYILNQMPNNNHNYVNQETKP